MMSDQNQVLTLTVGACAQALGISKNNAYALIHEGQIPALRLGRRLMIPRAALMRLLDEAGQDKGETGA